MNVYRVQVVTTDYTLAGNVVARNGKNALEQFFKNAEEDMKNENQDHTIQHITVLKFVSGIED